MTAREYRRVRGYVRANAKRWLEVSHRLFNRPVHCPQCAASGVAIPARCPHLGDPLTLAQREAHAWSRLPERAKAAILRPEVTP